MSREMDQNHVQTEQTSTEGEIASTCVLIPDGAMIRIGVAQTEPRVEDIEHTVTQIRDMLKSAAANAVDVLVLPELSNSGYTFTSLDEVKSRAETIPEGPVSTLLKDWSSNDRLVVAGLCESRSRRLYNSAAIFAGGMHLCTYRKIHLFARESEWFTSGAKEPPVIDFRGFKFGIMVCFDWAFPEIARILSLKGAQVILHPANLVLDYCQSAMITRSIENGVFTATANRVGQERELRFTGKSQITGNRGETLVRTSKETPELGWTDIDPSKAEDKMITKYNHIMRSRRPELYGRLVMKS